MVELSRSTSWRPILEIRCQKMHRNPICIVTGMEHSGTTVVSQLLNAHPRVAAGVECGLLLREPKEFDQSKPFWDWLLDSGWGWGLLPAQRAQLLQVATYDEAYTLLNRYKGSAHSGELREIFRSSDLIFDKTPAYVYHLPAIAKKVDAPIIVTLKAPAEAWLSAQKHGLSLPIFLHNYVVSTRAAAATPRAMIVFQRQIDEDMDAVMQDIAQYIGLPGDYSMDAYNRRFGRLIKSRNSFQKRKLVREPAQHSIVSRFLEWFLRSELNQLRDRATGLGQR